MTALGAPGVGLVSQQFRFRQIAIPDDPRVGQWQGSEFKLQVAKGPDGQFAFSFLPDGVKNGDSSPLDGKRFRCPSLEQLKDMGADRVADVFNSAQITYQSFGNEDFSVDLALPALTNEARGGLAPGGNDNEIVARSPADGIVEAYQRANRVIGDQTIESAVFVIGPTRSGKSLFVNAMANVPLVEVQSRVRTAYRAETGKSVTAIGQRGSQTLHCFPVRPEDMDITLIDTGGMFDLRPGDEGSRVSEVMVMTSLHAFLTHPKIKSVQITFCVEWAWIRDAEHFWNKLWSQFILGILPDLSVWKKRCCLVVTKVEPNQVDQVVGGFLDLIKENEALSAEERDFLEALAQKILVADYGRDLETFKANFDQVTNSIVALPLDRGRGIPRMQATRLAVSNEALASLNRGLVQLSEDQVGHLRELENCKTFVMDFIDCGENNGPQQGELKALLESALGNPQDNEIIEKINRAIDTIKLDKVSNLSTITQRIQEFKDSKGKLEDAAKVLRKDRMRIETQLDALAARERVNPEPVRYATLPCSFKTNVQYVTRYLWGLLNITTSTPMPEDESNCSSELSVGVGMPTKISAVRKAGYDRYLKVVPGEKKGSMFCFRVEFPKVNRPNTVDGQLTLELEVWGPPDDSVESAKKLIEDQKKLVQELKILSQKDEKIARETADINIKLNALIESEKNLLEFRENIRYRNALNKLLQFIEVRNGLIDLNGRARILDHVLRTCPDMDWGGDRGMAIFQREFSEFKKLAEI